jgi:hypothetical protein
VAMTNNARMLDGESMNSGAERLILSLVEARPRHGYDIIKLIEAQLACGHYTQPGHRRKHSNFQRRQGRIATPASVPGTGSAGDFVEEQCQAESVRGRSLDHLFAFGYAQK